MSQAQTCILRNIKRGEARDLPDIIITGSEKRKVIGRNTETQIESSSVSREHLLIKPKIDDKIILIRFIGKSPAALNGFVMKQEEAYEATEGDIISLVFNSDYQYEVTFPSALENGGSAKRSSQDEFPNGSLKRPKSYEEDKWGSVDNGSCIIFTSRGAEARSKIASYDMDNTIIKTVSGNVFPKNIDDWQLNYQSIPKKLKSLYDNGFKIVIFTNQGGVASGQTSLDSMKKKISMIQQRIDVPLQAFVATGPSKYRKPRTGMWETLESEEFNDGIVIDRLKSFYVGDAAGRPEVKLTKRKKDHSSADRLFAMNLGLSFYTPEEHFLNAKDTPKNWNKPAFDPKSVKNSTTLIEPSSAKLTSDETEVVMMVGFPGSGKSFFSHTHLKAAGYEIINRDTLKTPKKCLAVLEESIQNKTSCVIDNTNPDPTSRKLYIEKAKSLKVPIRCFLFNTTYEQAKHNNVFRELTDSSHQKINEMVFNIYKKNYVEPSKKEGFTEIVRVNFVPKFKNAEEETLYQMYLVEK